MIPSSPRAVAERAEALADKHERDDDSTVDDETPPDASEAAAILARHRAPVVPIGAIPRPRRTEARTPPHGLQMVASAAARVTGVLVVAALVLGPLPACTPAARQEAAAVVSTLAPALCGTLAAVLGPDGSMAGLVCADVSKALGAGLLLASASAPRPTALPVVTRAAACTPVHLTSADPGRDPREFVCAEAWGSPQAARLAILDALATGHAR